jgi:xanthomonalisin
MGILLALGGTAAAGAAGPAAGGNDGLSASFATLAPATTLAAGESLDGLLPFTTPVHVEVALKLRNQSQLDAFIAHAGRTSTPLAQRMMSPAQFAAAHSPTPAQAQAVAEFLQQAGFSHISIAPNRLLVSADGTADIVQTAFATSLAKVQAADGRDAFANTEEIHIPASLKPFVLAVLGLQTVHQAHPFVRMNQDGGVGTRAITGHYPTEFASIYGGSGVPTAAGITVGIITQGRLNQTITDLNTFTSQHGLATVTTQTINTNGTSSDSSGVGEWNLDSQDIVGMAGGEVGKLVFYNIPTLSNANLTADINTVVSANATKIINVSLGECETYTQQDGSAAAQDQSFQQAVAQGQTFSISTGDSGADECGDGGTTPSWPAASQYVIAAAGTRLNATTTTWSSETVWSDSGGSQSNFEPKPSWQTLWSGPRRGVADIAYDGDPNSGAKVVVNGSLEQIGGTSLSAPLFAGAWARMLAAQGTSLGFAGPLVYQLPAADFHDITSGNNNGSTAGSGYDLASGRGSLIMNQAVDDLGGGGGGGNVPPVANFTFTTSNLTANFTDTSSDSDGSISSRAWTFGDGGTSSAANPSHSYAAGGTYSVTLTVTDNDGGSDSKTQSVTVSSGGGGGNVLQNGVPATGLAATTGNSLMYTMVVPAGATNLSFAMSGGSGDADLYVRFGSPPTTGTFDCRPYLYGNNESCPISSPQAGTYYVMVNAYQSFSGVSLVGSYTAGGGGGGGNVLQNGVPVTGLHATRNNWSATYTMVVPSGASNLVFQISGGSGDADLYVRLGSAPSTSQFDCRPYNYGNNEVCSASVPTPGTYYVRVHAYQTYSGVSLVGSYDP